MYGTIVVTSVLVVYDGWGHLKLSDAVAIILGPVVAMGHRARVRGEPGCVSEPRASSYRA